MRDLPVNANISFELHPKMRCELEALAEFQHKTLRHLILDLMAPEFEKALKKLRAHNQRKYNYQNEVRK